MGRSARPKGEWAARYSPGVQTFFERGKEIGEPAVLVTVVVGAGPDTEFFHVVAHGGDAAGMNAGGIAQVGDDVFDFAERDEITQGFLAGIEPHALAAVFGDVSAEEFCGLESGGEKVHVVHEGVRDVSGGQNAGKLRLPNALGKPGAGGTCIKVCFEIASKAGDLFELVFRGNGDEDGFVKAPADELDLAALDQLFQPGKIFGAKLLDPVEKRAGIMKADMNARIFFKMLQKGEVGVVIGFFEDVLEIAARLVSVNEKG